MLVSVDVVGPTWVAPTPQLVPVPMIVSTPGSKIENTYVWVVTSDSSTVRSPLKNVVVGATFVMEIVVV